MNTITLIQIHQQQIWICKLKYNHIMFTHNSSIHAYGKVCFQGFALYENLSRNQNHAEMISLTKDGSFLCNKPIGTNDNKLVKQEEIV